MALSILVVVVIVGVVCLAVFGGRRSGGRACGLDVGLRADGKRLVLPYPKLPHMLIAGQTGSGKSGLINALLLALSGLQNVALVGADLKRVELSPWSARFTSLAVDGAGIDRLFPQLRAEIQRREQLLVSLGERVWRAAHGPWMVVIIDEFAELSVKDLDRLIEATQAPQSPENDKALNQMMRAAGQQLGLRSGILESFARKCRALGVTLVICTQYPTSDVLDTQVRGQLGLRFMCRVPSKEQVKVILGAGMEDDVEPTDIPVDQPGAFIVTGLDPKPFMARASWVDDQLVAARAAQTAHLRIPESVLFPSSVEPVPAPSAAPVGPVDDDGGVAWL